MAEKHFLETILSWFEIQSLRQGGWLVDFGWLVDWLVLVGWFWLVDWLIGWVVGWLIGCVGWLVRWLEHLYSRAGESKKKFAAQDLPE